MMIRNGTRNNPKNDGGERKRQQGKKMNEGNRRRRRGIGKKVGYSFYFFSFFRRR